VNIFADPTYSQTTRISLHLKDATIEEVLNKIEDVSEFYFLYNVKLIDVTRKVSIEADKEQIKDILKDILSNDTKFIVSDRQIILTQSDVTSLSAAMQQKKITGIVTDESGNPMPGVNIQVEGTTTGAISDIGGKYSIAISNDNAVLVFSFIGYNNQKVPAAGRTTIDVSLVPSIASLEEVLVVGYGTQKKINLTGSVSTLNAKKIQYIPVANTSNTIVGKIPGLIAVNRNGEPGRDQASISIRGFANMLIIVDGIEQPFDNIDPSEIENISILKDAAASIYGARAGNGVLLVTTRKGESGKPKISFSSSYGFQSPTRRPKLVDAPTYASMFNDAEVAAGRNPQYTPDEIEKYRSGTDPNYPNTNWYDEVFRKWAPINQTNLNTSGGGEQIKYFFSLGYLDQDGMLKSGDTKFQRYNVRSNIDAKITKSFSVSVNLSGRIEHSDYPGSSSAASDYGGITMNKIMEDLYFARPNTSARYPDPTKASYAGIAGVQPLARSDKDFSGYTDNELKFFTGAIVMKYDFPFIEGLSAKASFNYVGNYNYSKDWGKAVTIYNYDRATDKYSFAGSLGKDQLDESITRGVGTTSQLFLNYNRKWNKHDLSAALVGEFIENNANSFSAHRENYITSSIDQLFAGGDLNKTNNGLAWQDGRVNYAGRVNYSYAGKYLAEATLAYNASSKYMAARRWGFFPSVSLGWRISEEKFMKDISFISNLKLRASYGQAGDDAVSNYNYLTGYQFMGSYVFGESPQLSQGIHSKGLANPNLTWSNTAISNVGIDLSLKNEILGFEFDYFYRKVTNVPGSRSLSLPLTFGASLPQENLNSFNNRGFELLIRHKNTIQKLNYTIEGNLTYARAKWIHYDEPVFADDATRERLQLSGQWVNRTFGYEALGLFQSQEEIDNWKVIQDNNGNKSLKPGDIKYSDYNKDGIIDFKDNHVIGRGTTPDIIYGLTLNADYNGIDLSMAWQGAADFNAYFTGEAQSPFYNGEVPYQFLTDYWTPQNTGARFPRLYPGGATNNTFTSTYWLQNASYLRLKNIQLGYTFPKEWYTKWNIERLKVYVAAFNLITIDHVYPFDPETGNGRGWHYPQQKSVSFGINLTF
jgi:TonB-linked SusC/RagA family outer membrane protein